MGPEMRRNVAVPSGLLRHFWYPREDLASRGLEILRLRLSGIMIRLFQLLVFLCTE